MYVLYVAVDRNKGPFGCEDRWWWCTFPRYVSYAYSSSIPWWYSVRTGGTGSSGLSDPGRAPPVLCSSKVSFIFRDTYVCYLFIIIANKTKNQRAPSRGSEVRKSRTPRGSLPVCCCCCVVYMIYVCMYVIQVHTHHLATTTTTAAAHCRSGTTAVCSSTSIFLDFPVTGTWWVHY